MRLLPPQLLAHILVLLLFLTWYLGAVSTPPPIEPPTSENVHLYRAAVLAWRLAERNERLRLGDAKLVRPQVAQQAAMLAVKALAPEMTDDAAWRLQQKATAWAAQAHHLWFWKIIPHNAYS